MAKEESAMAQQARENIRKLMEGGGEINEGEPMKEHYEIIERFGRNELPGGDPTDVDEFLLALGNYRLLKPVDPEDDSFIVVRYAEVSEDD